MIRVMIIAKHVEVREGLCTVLALAGDIQITAVVSNLRSAVQHASTASPDVALVDLEMPEGEGYAAIRQMKRLFRKTKLIALTAHDYPDARTRAVQAGASMVIVKGMDLAEMIQALQDVRDEKKDPSRENS
jgi:two-component system, NarL family, response regulator DevR